jgi:hypothetical protein
VRSGRRQETEAAEAKWRGKGFTLPFLVIYRSRGATLPETPCAARINCRQRHPSLTSGTHHAEMAGCVRVRDHCGAATEGPRRPITSAPHVSHYTRGCTA